MGASVTDPSAGARAWPRGYRRLLGARVLLRGYFFVPFIVLYAQDIGVSLGTLLAVEAFFSLLVVAADLPAGQFADRIGPRQALVVGAALEAAGALLLGLWAHPGVFWAAQPLFAGAMALTQGADAGLAGALLRREERADPARESAFEAAFERGERILQSSSLGWNAAVFVAGSALSLISFSATFLATGIVQLVAVALLFTVPDCRTTGGAADGGPDERLGMAAWARQLRDALRRSPALRLDLAAMVLTGTAFAALLYLVPAFLVGAGVDAHLIGAASAGISLVAAGLGYLLPGGWNLRVPVLLAAAGTLAFTVPLAAVALAGGVLVQAGQARLLPRYRARVMTDLGRYGEAAAMSLVTTTTSLGFAVLAPFLGLLVDRLHRAGLALTCTALLLAAGATMSVQLRGPAGVPSADHPRYSKDAA